MDVSRLPGIHDLQIREREVVYVSSHEPEPVEQGGCRQQAVDSGNGPSGLGGQSAPAVGHRGIHGKEPVLEPGGQLLFQPEPELLPSGSTLQLLDTASELSQREDTQVKGGLGNGLQPVENTRMGPGLDALRDDVRVEEVAYKRTLRTRDRSRSTSIRTPARGERRRKATNESFLPLSRS
jgi:hypothetical protein